MTGMAGKRAWLSTEWVILSTWLLNSSEVKLWWAFTRGANTYATFAHLERCFHIVLPQMSFLLFFPVMVFPMTIQSVHWLQPMNQWTITHIRISPYMQNAWPCIPHKDLPTVKILLHWCPSGLSQEVVAILQLSTFGGGCLYKMQNYQKTRSQVSLPQTTNPMTRSMRAQVRAW